MDNVCKCKLESNKGVKTKIPLDFSANGLTKQLAKLAYATV